MVNEERAQGSIEFLLLIGGVVVVVLVVGLYLKSIAIAASGEVTTQIDKSASGAAIYFSISEGAALQNNAILTTADSLAIQTNCPDGCEIDSATLSSPILLTCSGRADCSRLCTSNATKTAWTCTFSGVTFDSHTFTITATDLRNQESLNATISFTLNSPPTPILMTTTALQVEVIKTDLGLATSSSSSRTSFAGGIAQYSSFISAKCGFTDSKFNVVDKGSWKMGDPSATATGVINSPISNPKIGYSYNDVSGYFGTNKYTVAIWDSDGYAYETTDGKAWRKYKYEIDSGGTKTQIIPTVGYNHAINGEWIVLWDSAGNYYSSTGDIDNDGKWEFLTNTLTINGVLIKPTLGYRHSIGGDWAVIWDNGKYYSTKGEDKDNDGVMDWLEGTFGSKLPVAEYSHSINGNWVVLWDGQGKYYSTQDAYNWNCGNFADHFGGSSSANIHWGNIIAPIIGFSHKIPGSEEIVLIDAAGYTYTTQDATNWVFTTPPT